jgi:hypothetical protein
LSRCKVIDQLLLIVAPFECDRCHCLPSAKLVGYPNVGQWSHCVNGTAGKQLNSSEKTPAASMDAALASHTPMMAQY